MTGNVDREMLTRAKETLALVKAAAGGDVQVQAIIQSALKNAWLEGFRARDNNQVAAELERRLALVKAQTSAFSEQEAGYLSGQECELESLLDWVKEGKPSV